MLFESLSEYRSPVAQVDLGTQDSHSGDTTDNPKVASPLVVPSPSSERRKMTGCGGKEALGAPLRVALPSMQSEGGWNRVSGDRIGSSPL